jgi:anaerobic magnesium-protoporphyrin IX monomethyl ester cyclase
MVFIGVESFDNESLKSLNKELVLKNISKLHLGIKYLHKRKIAVQTNIILGLPEDTDTHIRNRIVQAKSLGFDFLSFTALTPLPGTRIYKQVYDDLMQYNLNGKWNLFNFSNLLISRPDYTPENIENIHKKYKLKRNTKPLIKYISTFKTLIKTRNLKTTFFFYLLRTAYDSRLRKHRILRFLAKNS